MQKCLKAARKPSDPIGDSRKARLGIFRPARKAERLVFATMAALPPSDRALRKARYSLRATLANAAAGLFALPTQGD